ncbi:MAG: archaemetzincin [Phycisphaerae bacterium]|jgi:archaemetzincin|nr:archaemetzincin [Phycisphaerae bacterium]
MAGLLIVACLRQFPLSPSVADSPSDRTRAKQLKVAVEKLKSIHKTIRKPKPGDWLDRHYEPGQTFARYLNSNPVRPIGVRSIIYVQPLGAFTKSQRKSISLAAEFMGLYFNTKVVIRKDLPLTVIPPAARRVHPQWKVKQILSTYVLDKVLYPRLPKDAAAYIAFTASDLWPGAGWNFVFGQASLRKRVGVWSVHRNGEPDKSPADFRLFLLRTLKTATHETGHMFTMLHCTAYECNMCGSNHRQESDSRPIALGPECMAKVCWAGRIDPIKRFSGLYTFCVKTGLKPQAAFYAKSIETLGGKLPTTQPVSTSAPQNR